ncbi:MAG: transglycosylase SLT domain-containing protein [Bacteroidota bacterium]
MSYFDISPESGRGRLILIFFISFCIVYFVLKTFIYEPSHNSVSYSDNNFYVLDLSIPADLEFCGEKIPANNYEIKDDLKKEFFTNSYWKNNSLVFFRKAQKWFPYIEPILKMEGVPDDFKYLAVIESHLSNASSPAGASGFWQLLPGSARNYGLEVNDEVDERYHVEKATHAACKHIKDAHKVFRNWTLSAAAYNLGIGGIIGALRRQRTDNYFDLMLNRETGSFVYRILAYKTLFSSPGHFGIKKKKWSYFPKIVFLSFKVDSSITNLEAFARHIGSDVNTIKAFNPWLLKNTLTNPGGKVYEIRIPKNKSADYSGYAADLAREGHVILPHIEIEILKTTETKPDSTAPVSLTAVAESTVTNKTVYHTLKINENLKDVSLLYGVKEEDLRKWNDMREGDKPLKGQVLVIHPEVKK